MATHNPNLHFVSLILLDCGTAFLGTKCLAALAFFAATAVRLSI
jgi:hypothetical protein